MACKINSGTGFVPARIRGEEGQIDRVGKSPGTAKRPMQRQEDLAWFTPAGEQMSDEDWETGYAHSVNVFLNGDPIREPGPRGERITDDSFCLLLNPYHESIEFTLPPKEFGAVWELEFDTTSTFDPRAAQHAYEAAAPITIEARSVVLLRRAS